MGLFGAIDGTSDPILTRLIAEDKVPWYKKPNLRILYVYLAICCMGVEATTGFDSQLVNTIQFSTAFNKYFGNSYVGINGKPGIQPGLLGFLTSCYHVGSVLGVPVAPWFNQKFGRRKAILIGSLIMSGAAIIQGFSQHVAMYIISRILLGFGLVVCIISGSAMIGELSYPKERPIMTSLFNASWHIGSITASAIALRTVELPGDWAWRVPSLLQICPSLLQIIFVFFLPESPRWLVSKDRHEEALAVLIKYHGEGDSNSVIANAEYAQIKSTIKLEMEIADQSWMDMVKTAGMRRRVFIAVMLGCFTQLSGNTLLSYYSNLLFEMMGYTSNFAKTRINLANSCWSLLNAVIIAFIVTRFRRRWMFMLSAGSMCLVYVAMTVSFEKLREAKDAGIHNGAAAISALVFYFTFSPCYNIGNNSLTYTFLVELFPYAERTRGIAIEQFFGKASGLFSTNVNPVALAAIDWKYFAIYCGWLTFELGFIYVFYPETSGRTLEELAFLFEDKALTDQAVAAVEKQIHHSDEFEDAAKSHTVHIENKSVIQNDRV
ncbi:hexose transporter-like protein [Leptodontidium sp. MPI-SDFR-AT-0119]|nr:hexose transporter-like protein [Leptodontidium sp. MPI-SDFR-AT-0119]